MNGNEDQAIRRLLASYDSAMGPLDPPQSGRIWQRMEFRRRYRVQPGLYVYRNACREAMVATSVLVALIIKYLWDWVGASLLLELGGGLAVAVMLGVLARRASLLTLRD